MSGAYCSTCGQKTDVDPRSLRQWLHGILEDSLSIDGRLFQTLKALLTRPGFLTQEWRRGRQARWMHPFRLYLLASAIYFGVVALTPRDFVDVTVEDAAGLDIGMEAEIAAYGEAAAASAPRAMFLAVPLFALLLLLLFRGSGWLYTEHLVNALHLHAFFFLLLAVTWPMELLPSPWDFWLQTPFMILMLVYFLRALQNTYGGNVATLALRAVPLGIVYTICLAALVLIGGGLVGGAEADLQKSEDQYWSVRALDDAATPDRDRPGAGRAGVLPENGELARDARSSRAHGRPAVAAGSAGPGPPRGRDRLAGGTDEPPGAGPARSQLRGRGGSGRGGAGGRALPGGVPEFPFGRRRTPSGGSRSVRGLGRGGCGRFGRPLGTAAPGVSGTVLQLNCYRASR